jgi:hypothetical protein
MPILGIESLIYGVADVALSARFFDDFGLQQTKFGADFARFVLPEGSSVIIREIGDPALPPSALNGAGVHEVIWGVDGAETLEQIAASLASDHDIRQDADGTVHVTTDFGLAMGFRPFAKKPLISVSDPINTPGNVQRVNQHRKWRLRARPKTINHVVFAVPGHERAADFMKRRLNFRLSDLQRGIGEYLRADGANNHHNLLLLNAKADLPEMDGTVRFHHANFGVDDLDEIMIGANHMVRQSWAPSHFGLGRHRIDSGLFYYLPCPAGGEAEYGADADYVDDDWVPRDWPEPLFGYAHFVHNLPPFLRHAPPWKIDYLTDNASPTGGEER